MTTNADFWTSIAHIIEKGFIADGLQQLDRYAELFISEKLVYKRFSPLEQYGCAAGGTTHVIATLLAGAEVDADTFAPGISDFKRMCQRGETQALRIEQWAKAVGVWIDGIDDSLSPCPQCAQSPGLTKRTQPRGIRKKQSVSNK